ncbi:sialidase [Blumeria hordei DH14]|uniref:Sialidase n=1 Tax=Blumeria graminis f. sp. hordei (strain DH14) TaxID=546991 RepID=N1JCA7_BLUG1|nr:sialidase [Blumeria hordei DH14]
MSHSHQNSLLSVPSCSSSPDSVNTKLAKPTRLPIRQHGPTLLPKIRPQDQGLNLPPKRSKSVTQTQSNPTYNYPSSRRHTYPGPTSPTYGFPVNNNASINNWGSNRQCGEIFDSFLAPNTGLDSYSFAQSDLSFPTPISKYVAPISNQKADIFTPVIYNPSPYTSVLPLQTSVEFEELLFQDTLDPFDNGSCTTLSDYLTSPNPTPDLVRKINTQPRGSKINNFWWDVRQILPWTGFNHQAFTAAPGLHDLLNINVPSCILPSPRRKSIQPETELELMNFYDQYYATKLNAALELSLGPRHLKMLQSKKNSADPCFISNYIDEASQSLYGQGFGRIVGLVKSFSRWNSGMRVEGNHRKVEYLRGLSHLHQHMRENGCRYGFIMTEIELVVVRNSMESVPFFGLLEIQTIPLAANSSQNLASYQDDTSFGTNDPQPQPEITALQALWYLHMLARDSLIPGQVGWKSEVGVLTEGTRKKCLPRNKWMPEPNMAEKRDSKRTRGWIWPEEVVVKRKTGKRGVRHGSGK